MPRARIHRGHRLRTGRWSETRRVYMVTTVTRDRLPLFTDWNKACACARVLHHAPARIPVTSLVWVVMPDHVHWMFRLDAGTLGEAMRRFKSYSSRTVNALSATTGSIWQAGYHDHAVRRDEDLRDLARYVVANPVRAGLCRRVGDYPFWDAAWLETRDTSAAPEDIVM